MPGEVRARLKEHAARLGMDVSTFITVAIQAQMDEQDRIRKIFEPLEALQAEAEAQAEPDTWTDDIDLTPEEQAEVDAILGRSAQHREAA